MFFQKKIKKLTFSHQEVFATNWTFAVMVDKRPDPVLIKYDEANCKMNLLGCVKYTEQEAMVVFEAAKHVLKDMIEAHKANHPVEEIVVNCSY